MQKLNPKQFLLRTPSIYDIKSFPPLEKREEILRRRLAYQPKYVVKGGNSKTNPYKILYDVELATRRERFEELKNSKLWSPHYTISHFKFFVSGLCFTAFFLFYIRYIQTPRNMMHLKKTRGFNFPELEEKGWLKEWDDESEIDLFSYDGWEKWTLDDKKKKEGGEMEGLSKVRREEWRGKMSNNLQNLYGMRKEKGLNEA